jgi:hypothetical protein
MVESEMNARRSDEAERSRHLSATESVAFATMLLGLLNNSDTVLHRLEHDGEARAAERQAHPAETAAAPAPADAGLAPQDQHAGTMDAPAAGPAPTVHAEAIVPPQDAGVTVDDTSSAGVVTSEVLASSPAPSSFSGSIDHVPSTGPSSAPAGGAVPTSLDPGMAVHGITDTVTGIADTALATVSSTIASVSATVGQLTSTLTDTVSYLTDGLLGTITGASQASHEAASAGGLEPLVANLLGPLDTPDAPVHSVPLLDTAGAIPTSLLHPMPLQLSFLGQPTMDGHEPHDGAISALGVHHF